MPQRTGGKLMSEAESIFNRSAIHKFLIPIAIGVAIWFIPAPEGVKPQAWQMLAIFVATIAGIITAPLPMSAVAIIGATVASLLGVIKFSDVVKSTGTDLVWLVLLAFFISRGVIKTGLGRRIGLLFLRALGKRTLGLGYGLALTELLVAPATAEYHRPRGRRDAAHNTGNLRSSGQPSGLTERAARPERTSSSAPSRRTSSPPGCSSRRWLETRSPSSLPPISVTILCHT